MPKLAASIVVGPFTFCDCSYDAGADVAYLSAGEPVEAFCWESPEGHLVRLDRETYELVGITLLHPHRRVESAEELGVTLPRHVLVAAEGPHGPSVLGATTLPRAELAALCA